MALFTRRLFENWFGAAVRYLLIRHGLAGGLVTVRCGGSVHGLSPDLYSFIVNSYYDGSVGDAHCLGSHINLGYKGVPLAVVPPDFVVFFIWVGVLGLLVHFHFFMTLF